MSCPNWGLFREYGVLLAIMPGQQVWGPRPPAKRARNQPLTDGSHF